MINDPVCSVVLAVRNDEKYICRSLLSMLHQTLPEIEVIVVDDESTDRTPELLAQLARRDPRLRVIRNEQRKERSRSRNLAAAEACAPYIAIMDSDDISMPERLEWQLAYMDRHPDVVMLGGQYHFIDPAGEMSFGPVLPVGVDAVMRRMRFRNAIQNGTVIIRREFYQKTNGFDPRLVHSEDYDFFWRLSQYGPIDNLAEIVLLYHRDWRKEHRLHYKKRLAHVKIRLRWLLKTGMGLREALDLLVYTGYAISPSFLINWHQKHRYSAPVPPAFVTEANDWLRKLAALEQELAAEMSLSRN